MHTHKTDIGRVVFLTVGLVVLLGILPLRSTFALERTSTYEPGDLEYVRIFTAMVENAVDIPLDELDALARAEGTEEVAAYLREHGPERKALLWLIRNGSEEYACPGITSKVRTLLEKQQRLGTLSFSEDGREATSKGLCQGTPMEWTIPKNESYPLVCEFVLDEETVGCITVHEIASPWGYGPIPSIFRFDDLQGGKSLIQVYEYLDGKPQGLPERKLAVNSRSDDKKDPEGPQLAPLVTGKDYAAFEASWEPIDINEDWGWSNSWVGFNFHFAVGCSLGASINGDFVLDWASASAGSLTVGSAEGSLGMDFGLAFSGTFTFDICEILDMTIPIPYLPNFDFGDQATTTFNSYLLDGTANVTGNVTDVELYSFAIIPDSLSSVDANLVLKADIDLSIDMSADDITTGDAVVFESEGQTEYVNLVNNVYSQNIEYHESLSTSLLLTFYPDVCVNYHPFDCKWLPEISFCLSDFADPPSYTWDLGLPGLAPDLAFPAYPLHFDSTNVKPNAVPELATGSRISLDGRNPVAPDWGAECQVDLFTFEGMGTGATEGWVSHDISGRGDFANVFTGLSVLQDDHYNINSSFLWAFIDGSTELYTCGDGAASTYPAVPSGVPYLLNEIWSPIIDWSPCWPCNNAVLRFDVYRDLPFDFGVFYVWRVRSWHNEVAGPWRDRGMAYYGTGKTCISCPTPVTGGGRDWFRAEHSIGDMVDPGVDSIQVALGVWDMYGFWNDRYAFDECHSNAPLFDNVEIVRYCQPGPVWGVREIDLFQDNFPNDGTDSGTARADMAQDVNGSRDGPIVPGDSVCAWVSDSVNGLNSGPGGCGAAVYCYVSVRPTNYDPSILEAPEVGRCAGRNGSVRYPVVGSVVVGGLKWHIVQMDTCFNDDNRQDPVPNRFCVDVNDYLFTPPDTAFFFFGAENNLNEWTYWSEFTGEVSLMETAADNPMEFQILPTGNSVILYVDKYDGMGAQPSFETAFEMLEITPDRYDVRGPSSLVGNSLGGRVKNVAQQLNAPYETIIWNTGDLAVGTIADGVKVCKEDDGDVLFRFLDGHTDDNGQHIYFSGDDIAEEWVELTGGAANMKSTYIKFNLLSGNHYDGSHASHISPTVISDAGSWLTSYIEHGPPDTLVAYGGHPIANDFDVIQPLGDDSNLEMTYEDKIGSPAVIVHSTTNPQSRLSSVVLSGFSFHSIYDDRPSASIDRAHHLYDILYWFGHPNLTDPLDVAEAPPLCNSLAQNYPNPFNPTTTIEYSIKETAPVSLRIYDVAGRLVKTLVDQQRHPSKIRSITWDGRNNKGDSVASGVYFYRLVTKDYASTKKMVILK